MSVGPTPLGIAITPASSEPNPSDLLQKLRDDVSGVGPGTSLADKIELAQVYLAANDIPATCAVLTDFLNQVRAQSGKKLTAQQAADFESQAIAIMDAIGCVE